MKSFVAELHRRNVFRSGLAYLATSWLLTEVCGTLFPAFGVPDWAMRMLVIVLLLGLPVVLTVSWIYELTPEGFKRDTDVEPHESIRHTTGRKLDFVVIGALSVVVALLLYDRQANPAASAHPANAMEQPSISVAVLPFVNMSGDQANIYFSDGISEELLNALTGVSKLHVVGRNSSFAFRGSQEDLRSIGQKLNASNILAGSVRKAGKFVRISAQLINAQTGFQLWSHTYNRKLDDIFEVQENIARSIISALELQLLPGQVPGHISTRNTAAFDLYLQAREVERRAESIAERNRAIDLFDRALAADANFVEAMAGKCQAYVGAYEDTRDSRLFELATQTCDHAVKMDENNVETRMALGDLNALTGRNEVAIAHYREVIRWQPGNDGAYLGLGAAQSAAGDIDAAEKSFQRAIELRPDSVSGYSDYGVALYHQGRFARARKQFLIAIGLNKTDASLYSRLGAADFYLGKFTEAAESFRQSIVYRPNPTAYSNAGTNYYFGGNFKAALTMFEKALELSPTDFRFHGFSGDACRWIDADKAQVRMHYLKAVELADEHLAVNPSDWAAVALRATYLGFLGDRQAARTNIELALSKAGNDIDVQQTAAVAWNHLGAHDRALAAIHAALDGGYPKLALEADPDLKNLTAKGQLTPLAAAN